MVNIFNNIFGSKKLPSIDFSEVGVDIHSHLLPGIDDGSKSIEESVELISKLKKLGYRKLIVTPHIMTDMFPNTPEIINEKLTSLRLALNAANIDIQIEASAEYFLDYNFEELFKTKKIIPFSNKYILFELSYFNPPENLEAMLFAMQIEGYKPILAHPERYPYWSNNFAQYQKLKDREVLFQLNMISLTGSYSVPTMKLAEKFIENDMIEFVGTDMHNLNYYLELEKAGTCKHLHKLLDSGKLLNNKL